MNSATLPAAWGGLAVVAVSVLLAAPPVAAATPPHGFYTTAQAEAGHDAFNNHCAECHRPDLTGAMGPALIGRPFFQHWGGQTVEALYQFEHTRMPATNPGSLPPDQVLAITAYILKRNGLPAGSTILDEAAAKQFTLPAVAP